MTDELPTVWEIEPHTRVKHDILRRYLQAWLPILTHQARIVERQLPSRQSREILFIDGFAGPGEYASGEPGSPVIALRAAIDHDKQFPSPVRMLFVEQRDDRFLHLSKVIAPHLDRARRSKNPCIVELRQGDCDTVLNGMLDEFGRNLLTFGPALAFLDQFGYGAVSMDLIKRILSFPQCEVFTYLSYKVMNRWITDPNKAEPFTRAFGGQDWRDCVSLPAQDRRDCLLKTYKAALKTRANAKYVVSFLMFDKNSQPLYWLLFCTNNLRGLEEMKKAMWHVDKAGEFRFSDREDPDQLKLLEQSFDQNWLAEQLRERLASQSLSALDVKEFVLAETPCCLFKDALRSLEKEGAVEVVDAPSTRRPGTYRDDSLEKIKIRFIKRLF